MATPFFNEQISPEIAKPKIFPKSPSPKVVHYSPLKESVGRLEEQNLEALGALAEISERIKELIEVNHMESKKMEQLAKMQDVLLEEQDAAEKDRKADHQELQANYQEIEGNHKELQDNHKELRAYHKELKVNQGEFLNEQNEMQDMLRTLLSGMEQSATHLKEFKESFYSVDLANRLSDVVQLLQNLKSDQEKENDSVLESNNLQNLLLEEVTRKQSELAKEQKSGFKKILEKLNLIKSDTTKDHDTQLENQKLMVDSLFKLLNEEKFLKEINHMKLEQR